jgi:hypothetical protein
MSTYGSKREETGIRQAESVIAPGRCDPVYGCPPPTEIVCILTEKVYDECKNIQVSEDTFIFEADPDNTVTDVECKNVEILDGPHCSTDRPGQVRVSFTYRVSIRVSLYDGQKVVIYRDFTDSKMFKMARAGEEFLVAQCSVPYIECLDCFVKKEEPDYDFVKTTIVCSIGKYHLIKLKAQVQLLIPSYGSCPPPPDCEGMADKCTEFHPPWPPFPLRKDT